ncbi:hypothetical protein ACE6H2_010012 [Prunus campanulata]
MLQKVRHVNICKNVPQELKEARSVSMINCSLEKVSEIYIYTFCLKMLIILLQMMKMSIVDSSFRLYLKC